MTVYQYTLVGAHIANMMPYIPQIPHQTGLVRTGMVLSQGRGTMPPPDFNFLRSRLTKHYMT